MADVDVSYGGSTIVSLSSAGTEILETKDTFLTDDIAITYTGGGGMAVFDEVVTLPGGGDHHIITGVDISSDTVTAEHLETGYTAHDADGNAITGTLTPGGGGLEYEEGTWTPTEDIADTTISFANLHSEPPIIVMMADDSSQSIGVDMSNAILLMGNMYTYLGHTVLNGTTARYGMTAYNYTSGSGFAGSLSYLSTAATLDTYFTSTSFRAYAGGTSRYWRAGRAYKWIAVWAPTT